jgi:hypothetical protein
MDGVVNHASDGRIFRCNTLSGGADWGRFNLRTARLPPQGHGLRYSLSS